MRKATETPKIKLEPEAQSRVELLIACYAFYVPLMEEVPTPEKDLIQVKIDRILMEMNVVIINGEREQVHPPSFGRWRKKDRCCSCP